ncbi:MAG: glycosyltransferase family protein [Fidelibacterota bacterium]
MTEEKGKRILYAVLNWGYGHTIHAFPLIEFLNRHHEVILAADGQAMILLRRRFPRNLCIPLKDARIRYTKHKILMPLSLGIQAVKMLTGMKREHRLTKNLVKHLKIDRIISDNRYGVWDRRIPSYLITHQLRFHMPIRHIEPLSILFNRIVFNGFTGIWALDSPHPEKNLSGSLTHDNPLSTHPKVRFMGLWSDLIPQKVDEDIDFLAILSGPEPMRTLLEDTLLEQMSRLPGKKVLVRGIDGHFPAKVEDITLLGLVDRDEINHLINRSRMVICRSGYTSTMDLVRLGKKAVMVPTPGQSEQEYQAELYHSRGWFYAVRQDEMDLVNDVEAARAYHPPDLSEWFNRTDWLEEAIREWPKERMKK